MAFLFDTDAISELLRPKPLTDYVEWIATIPRDEQFTSAVVIGELFKGACRSQARERHLENIETRVLPAVIVRAVRRRRDRANLRGAARAAGRGCSGARRSRSADRSHGPLPRPGISQWQSASLPSRRSSANKRYPARSSKRLTVGYLTPKPPMFSAILLQLQIVTGLQVEPKAVPGVVLTATRARLASFAELSDCRFRLRLGQIVDCLKIQPEFRACAQGLCKQPC